MDRAPNAWDRFYKFQESPWRGERALAPLRPWLGKRILELGCGNGKLLKPLQAAGHDVVGLDISWNVLQRLGQGVLADASALPFVDGSFDTVFDIHCTGHLLRAGRQQAMQEMVRTLAPGGHIVMERLHTDDLRATKGTPVEADTRQLQDGRTTHFSTETSLGDAMEALGLQVVHAETTRRQPKLRGEQVTRASVLVVGRAA